MTFSTGRREFLQNALGSSAVRLVEGDVLDRSRCCAMPSRVATGSFTSRPTPTCVGASSIPGVTCDRTRLRPQPSWRRCEPRGEPDRVLLDGLGVRRTGGLPDPRGRALPGPDLALCGLEARGRGPDRGLRRRVWLHRADLPLCLDPRRALHARPRVRLLPRAQRDPTQLRVLGDGRQEKSYLYVGDCICRDPHRGRAPWAGARRPHLQPWRAGDDRRR